MAVREYYFQVDSMGRWHWKIIKLDGTWTGCCVIRNSKLYCGGFQDNRSAQADIEPVLKKELNES
jgi:hypothetical protein